MNYTFWKRKEPVPLTRQFAGRQIFHAFSYCAPRATKRQPVSSLSVQGLPVSLCVAKHYQQHAQIFHKLRKISWGSSERIFFFSKSLTSRTIYICTREWFIVSKNNTFFKLLYLGVWLLYPDLYVSEKNVSFAISFLLYKQSEEFCPLFTTALHTSSSWRVKRRGNFPLVWTTFALSGALQVAPILFHCYHGNTTVRNLLFLKWWIQFPLSRFKHKETPIFCLPTPNTTYFA